MVVGAALRLGSGPRIWVFHDVTDRVWFERCIEEISSALEVVPLADLAREPNRRNACAITFDDGLRSVFDVARPVLAARGHPYTVFVCTDVLTGGPAPWFLRIAHLVDCLGLDPVRRRWGLLDPRWGGLQEIVTALKEVPLDSILAGLDELEGRHSVVPPDPRELFLSADEVKALSGEGVTIGSHSHRHPILSSLGADEQRSEVEASSTTIERIVARRPTEFAYPNGSPLDFTATTTRILRDSGFQLAVTTTQRRVTSRDDLFALPRIGLGDGDPLSRRVLKSIAPWLARSAARERALRSKVVR